MAGICFDVNIPTYFNIVGILCCMKVFVCRKIVAMTYRFCFICFRIPFLSKNTVQDCTHPGTDMIFSTLYHTKATLITQLLGHLQWFIQRTTPILQGTPFWNILRPQLKVIRVRWKKPISPTYGHDWILFPSDLPDLSHTWMKFSNWSVILHAGDRFRSCSLFLVYKALLYVSKLDRGPDKKGSRSPEQALHRPNW